MKPAPSVATEKTSIQVIERMISLLDALAHYPDPVSLKELSTVTGLHPSTAHRILNDMVVKRFVDRAEAGSYRLGMRLLELGNIVKSRLNVREAALDFMRALHRKTHQTINLSVRQGDEIVYIDRSFSERSGMQVVRAIGGRAPLHLTSTGKLFLSADDPKAVRAYATRTGLAGHNKNSSLISASWNATSAWCGRAAMRATMKNLSWACAAWRQASMMIRASSLPACRFPRQPTVCRMNGWKIWSAPRMRSRPCWAMCSQPRRSEQSDQ